MKNILALSVISFLFTPAFAQHKHSHREHGAHQHGHGEVAIAFDGLKGKVEFKSPSDSVVGFEFEPKNAKQKRQRDEAFAKLKDKIGDMIAFEASLSCVFSDKNVEMVREKPKSSHSETRGAFDVECAKSPLGSTVKFNFVAQFPKLVEVDVTFLMDTLQKQIEVGKDGASLELK